MVTVAVAALDASGSVASRSVNVVATDDEKDQGKVRICMSCALGSSAHGVQVQTSLTLQRTDILYTLGEQILYTVGDRHRSTGAAVEALDDRQAWSRHQDSAV